MFNKKTIMALISLVIVSISLATVSVAWIAMNRQVGSNNNRMTIQAVSDVTTISCYALRYDGNYGAVCYKIGEGEGEVLDVEMTEYDRIFRDRTVNTPMIYVVELANVPEGDNYNITVKVPCNEKYIITEGEAVNSFESVENGPSFTNQTYIQNYISNVISVKIACGGQIEEPTATLSQAIPNNVAIFNAQRDAFREVTSGATVGQFASFSGDKEDIYGTYSKTTSVQVKLSYSDYEGKLFTIANEPEDTGNHLTLYIQIDYDDNLMDAYIKSVISDDDEDVIFRDDLGAIQILVGTGGN